ncbi:bifunctional ADP-dependent NAD(P)H-hydrate dehydratase/NAD(P)H-hydrate epimerase [Loktanella sp. D2R18]|uniref:NAD(P)H-hydrate dehydratase n=1 Tax=Rhodobacterales TaxID=204455 RepID=UPI000DE8AD8E|nr:MULTISPECIES: NAD(P)H-hydrate dehydratase [Rhodobacterales]MDO6589744.1 NAD(P)H-hydrate dehydratase [Yoonia sp. 1_MG-2023]RBW44368.1 bifunctional ADP-dependent NAD(P)H-hydrate dehydratase/NAD(P)H-hydrate epimerase [Loktanella sp. D2R18]
MTELLTAAQMRAIEAAAIASGDVTGLELMERAGRGVVTAIFEEWPELAPPWGPAPKPPEYFLQDDEKGKHRAVVLCGPGNNGGDGFVVARLLFEAGWEVEVFLYGDAAKLPPDAKVNYARWCDAHEVGSLVAYEVGSLVAYVDRKKWCCDILVDALFGAGLPLPMHGLSNFFWNTSDMRDCYVPEFGHPRGRPGIVSVDVPSGVCSETGRTISLDDYDPNAISSHLTVSFHRAKLGLFLDDGPQYAGKIVVRDLGIKREPKGLCAVRIVSAPHASWVTKDDVHKYSHGHALILSGGIGKGGAARLAARGALRIGAGAVTVGCPEDALIENAAHLNAVMLTPVNDAVALGAILTDARINALCVGPGLGLGARGVALVAAVLESGRAAVLDADALTLLARDADLFAALHKSCVLTPHAGEFARLFPDIAEKLNAPATTGPAYSKVDATREAAKRAGCVILFKGPDTVIADPTGRCSINASVYERAAPWLATAGSGDALAGFITGLLARGFAPMQAAETGAWLHTECALNFGPGLIAEDLPEQLPAVLRALDVP